MDIKIVRGVHTWMSFSFSDEGISLLAGALDFNLSLCRQSDFQVIVAALLRPGQGGWKLIQYIVWVQVTEKLIGRIRCCELLPYNGLSTVLEIIVNPKHSMH